MQKELIEPLGAFTLRGEYTMFIFIYRDNQVQYKNVCKVVQLDAKYMRKEDTNKTVLVQKVVRVERQ
jgi:hypothetical protein